MPLTQIRGTNFHTHAEQHIDNLRDSEEAGLELKIGDESLLNALIFGG
jgi:hypothetical protein